MKFSKIVLITNSQEFATLKMQRGQWIKLAWCDKPSRWLRTDLDSFGNVRHVAAIHYPRASTFFWNKI